MIKLLPIKSSKFLTLYQTPELTSLPSSSSSDNCTDSTIWDVTHTIKKGLIFVYSTV